MGLGDFSTQEEETSSESQSTYVSFKNPEHPEQEISDNSKHRHKQEYFDAVQWFRDKLGQDINVPFGEFAVAARKADQDDDPSDLQELFERIAE